MFLKNLDATIDDVYFPESNLLSPAIFCLLEEPLKLPKCWRKLRFKVDPAAASFVCDLVSWWL